MSYFNKFEYSTLLNLYCTHCNELIRTISYNLCCLINNERIQMKIQDQSLVLLSISTILRVQSYNRMSCKTVTIIPWYLYCRKWVKYIFLPQYISSFWHDWSGDQLDNKTVNTAEKDSWFDRWSIENFRTFSSFFCEFVPGSSLLWPKWFANLR